MIIPATRRRHLHRTTTIPCIGGAQVQYGRATLTNGNCQDILGYRILKWHLY
jgi:hypothetical protein